MFIPIPKTKWTEILNDIFEKNSVQNEKISISTMKPILYHFYAIKRVYGPDTNYDIEIDHIIPQTLFDRSTIADKEYLKHNLFNLALLPKNENIYKGNKRLIEIQDNWFIDQIEKYEFIKKDDFSKYSDLNQREDLKDYREKIFHNTFESKGDDILNN